MDYILRAQTAPSNACILVVNECNIILNRITQHLSRSGFTSVMVAESAQMALSILHNHVVHYLIIDTDIPDMDGWRLTRLIRSGVAGKVAHIPIAMTTHVWCERIAEVTAREYGVNYLISLDQLLTSSNIFTELFSCSDTIVNKQRLLVINNDAAINTLIATELSNRFKIDYLDDIAMSLECWNAYRHDIILLNQDVYPLAEKTFLIDIQAKCPKQPVVIISHDHDRETAIELMLLGATDILLWPFDAEALRKACDIAIHRDDYLVSQQQFSNQVSSLQKREVAFKKLFEDHQQILNDIPSIVVEVDATFAITYLNTAWERIIGFSKTECLGQQLDSFISIDHLHQFLLFKRRIVKAFENGVHVNQIELCFISATHQRIWVNIRISSFNSDGHRLKLMLSMDDITDRKSSEEKLKYLAMHDQLTGLHNREYFESALAHFTADAFRNKREHVLAYIDLDHFKLINDTFGHHAGDAMLRNIAQQLKARTRSTDTLCRLGGDEFAILLHDTSLDNAQQFVHIIQDIVSEYFYDIDTKKTHLGCSIGLTSIDSRISHASLHLMHAEIALYVAKARGRNIIHVYDPKDSDTVELKTAISITQKVRKAILENRIELYFQPIYNMSQNCICYYEALVRIRTRDGLLLGPEHFICALESAGDMPLLDHCIFNLAIEHLATYPELEKIAINISAQTFKDEHLVDKIQATLRRHNVPAEKITFELTESASLIDVIATQDVIADLHALGCKFSIDDFGAWFSSFSYLKNLPADFIKLDGSFIKNLHIDAMDRLVVQSMINVIQSLGKKAVAEYVENEEVLNLLRDFGVDYVQGFYISPPMAIHDACAFDTGIALVM